MTRLVSVEGYSNLKRDQFTGCIINTDQKALDAIIKRREAEDNQKKDIEALKSEMSEIKQTLNQVLGLLLNGTRNTIE